MIVTVGGPGNQSVRTDRTAPAPENGVGLDRISCTFRLSPIFCRFPGGARSESSPARSTEFDLRENMGSSWKFRRISSENWRLIERDGAIQPGAASSMGPPKKGR